MNTDYLSNYEYTHFQQYRQERIKRAKVQRLAQEAQDDSPKPRRRRR